MIERAHPPVRPLLLPPSPGRLRGGVNSSVHRHRRAATLSLVLVAISAAATAGQPVTLTQSTGMSIAPGTPACAWGGGASGFELVTADNQYWRSFDLAVIPTILDGGLTVESVTIGVEEAAHPSGSQSIGIDLYRDLDGGAPTAVGQDLVPIAAVQASISNTTLSLVTIPIAAAFAKSDTLVVRISAPNYIPEFCPPPLGTNPNPFGEHAAFIPGSNRSGETAPGYMSTTACHRPVPQTFASIGYPAIALVLRVQGRTAPVCYANCDGSTAPPILNINDFQCFLNRYAAGDAAANCDGSTIAPVLNVIDFVCFQSRYAAGCP